MGLGARLVAVSPPGSEEPRRAKASVVQRAADCQHGQTLGASSSLPPEVKVLSQITPTGASLREAQASVIA